MRKSSRLWWLHGAILLSAVIGCKNCGSSGSCAPGGAPGATGSPYAGPAMTGGPMTYSQSTPGMTGASPMPGSTGSGYQMPNMSSSGIGGR